jgi:hypothetical protein
MLDGLSDDEWRELTDLVVTCADDRLACVVHDIARITRETSTSGRLLARGEFYRTLLLELRRRSIH